MTNVGYMRVMLRKNQNIEEDYVEPEVIPPQRTSERGPVLWVERMNQTFGPIVAGILIDTLDAATLGRFGLLLGMMLGGSAAYWMCSIYRLPIWQRLGWALVAGLYCTWPRTEFIPLATLIAAFSRYRNA